MEYRLKSLYINSFRGFNEFILEINEKLTVLVGKNGVGKTTILEIIYNMLIANTKYLFDIDNFSYVELKYSIDNIDNILSFKKENNNVNIYMNNNRVSSENELFKNRKVAYFPVQNYRSNDLIKDESIILIDNLEISMHPKLQQIILKHYTNLNSNGQFIFSTYSPQIISCCKKEEVRLIEKVNGKLKIKNDIIETYGLNDEAILLNIFNLKSVRNREVNSKIEEYKSLYCKFDLNVEEKKKLKRLKEELKSMNISENDLEEINSNLNTEKLKNLFKT